MSVTISDWFFLVALLLVVLEMLARKNIEAKLPKYLIWGLFVFSLGGLISSGAAPTPQESFLALTKYIYLIGIWFWLGTVLLRRPEHIRTAMILWTLSAAVTGVGAVAQLVWGDVIPLISLAWGRMTGFTEHVNDLAGVTSVALAPALALVIYSANRIWTSSGASILVFLISIGLVLSVSISGAVAALASLLVWAIMSNSPKKHLVVFSISVALIFVVITYQADYVELTILTRLSDISVEGGQLYTLASRLETYSAAWGVILQNPLVGVGLGPFTGTTKTGHVVHNIFLLSWYEAGVFGFLGMLIIIGTVAWVGIKLVRYPRSHQERVIGAALFASYIGFLVLGMAQPIYYKRFGWISAALLLALYALRRLPVTIDIDHGKPTT